MNEKTPHFPLSLVLPCPLIPYLAPYPTTLSPPPFLYTNLKENRRKKSRTRTILENAHSFLLRSLLIKFLFSLTALAHFNKAGYLATLVACGWAGAVLEKVTRASGEEPYAQKAQKRQKTKEGTDQPTDHSTDQPT